MVPLAAEPLFQVGPLTVTNSLLNACVASLIFCLVAWALQRVLRRSTSGAPGGFQNALEMGTEGLLGFFDQVTGNRVLTKKFLPLVGSLFCFILLSNWLGLVPGTGSIGLWVAHGDAREFIPLFRAATSDLNLTIALAVIAVIGSHLAGIRSNGPWKHINRFIQIEGVFKAIVRLKPLGIFVALAEFVVGVIEIFSEFAKLASLSLRLFGNVFAGEVLLSVISALFAYVAPLPFMSLELIVGIVQATVFSILTLVYFVIMTSPPHGAAAEAH